LSCDRNPRLGDATLSAAKRSFSDPSVDRDGVNNLTSDESPLPSPLSPLLLNQSSLLILPSSSRLVSSPWLHSI
jgi:hypothetical protein